MIINHNQWYSYFRGTKDKGDTNNTANSSDAISLAHL